MYTQNKTNRTTNIVLLYQSVTIILLESNTLDNSRMQKINWLIVECGELTKGMLFWTRYFLQPKIQKY